MAYTRSNEINIQNSICEYLQAKRHFFYRNNTVGIYDKAQGTHRSMPKFSKKGVPDIILIKNGIFYGLEVKDKSKQSEDQRLFEIGCKIAGGQYHIVRSIDDVQKLGL